MPGRMPAKAIISAGLRSASRALSVSGRLLLAIAAAKPRMAGCVAAITGTPRTNSTAAVAPKSRLFMNRLPFAECARLANRLPRSTPYLDRRLGVDRSAAKCHPPDPRSRRKPCLADSLILEVADFETD